MQQNQNSICTSVNYASTVPFSMYFQGAESFLRSKNFSASQEIPHILWNPRFQIPRSKQPALSSYPESDSISQRHPPYSYRIHFGSILQSTSTACTSPLPPPYSSLFDHPNIIGWEVQIMKFLSKRFPLVPSSFFPLLPKYLHQHPILELFMSSSFYKT
jgi:hypothetical protein